MVWWNWRKVEILQILRILISHKFNFRDCKQELLLTFILFPSLQYFGTRNVVLQVASAPVHKGDQSYVVLRYLFFKKKKKNFVSVTTNSFTSSDIIDDQDSKRWEENIEYKFNLLYANQVIRRCEETSISLIWCSPNCVLLLGVFISSNLFKIMQQSKQRLE